MSIGYKYYSHYQSSVPRLFLVNDPFSRQREFELEAKLRYGREDDPERPPTPTAGDKYIVIGAIVGLIIGGTLGVVIGSHYFDFLGGSIGLVGGIIIGGIIGAKIGNIVKNRQQKTKTNKSHSNLP